MDSVNPIYAKLQEMAEENLTADKVFELFEAEQIAVELQIRPDRFLRYAATTCDKTFWGDTAWSALWQAWAHYYEFVKEHVTPQYTVMRLTKSDFPAWTPQIQDDEELSFILYKHAEDAALQASGLALYSMFRIQMPDGTLLTPLYFLGKKWVSKKN